MVIAIQPAYEKKGHVSFAKEALCPPSKYAVTNVCALQSVPGEPGVLKSYKAIPNLFERPGTLFFKHLLMLQCWYPSSQRKQIANAKPRPSTPLCTCDPQRLAVSRCTIHGPSLALDLDRPRRCYEEIDEQPMAKGLGDPFVFDKVSEKYCDRSDLLPHTMRIPGSDPQLRSDIERALKYIRGTRLEIDAIDTTSPSARYDIDRLINEAANVKYRTNFRIQRNYDTRAEGCHVSFEKPSRQTSQVPLCDIKKKEKGRRRTALLEHARSLRRDSQRQLDMLEEAMKELIARSIEVLDMCDRESPVTEK